jgi:hypothetical protein
MPVKTKPDTKTPARPLPDEEPWRRYNPERLCPSQRKDAEKYSRP